jgi:hypothetical protein
MFMGSIVDPKWDLLRIADRVAMVMSVIDPAMPMIRVRILLNLVNRVSKQTGEPICTSTELRKSLGLEQSFLRKHLTALEECDYRQQPGLGYIQLAPNPDNKKLRDIRITQKGWMFFGWLGEIMVDDDPENLKTNIEWGVKIGLLSLEDIIPEGASDKIAQTNQLIVNDYGYVDVKHDPD